MNDNEVFDEIVGSDPIVCIVFCEHTGFGVKRIPSSTLPVDAHFCRIAARTDEPINEGESVYQTHEVWLMDGNHE